MIQIIKLCRICIRSEIALKDINNEDKDGIKLITKLKICLPEIIQKQTEIFSYICNECYDELKQSYTFVTKCMKSENVLLGYAEKLTQETEPDLINLKSESFELSLHSDESCESSTVNCDSTEVPSKCEPNVVYGSTVLEQPTEIKIKANSQITKLKMQRYINASRRNKMRFTNSVKIKEKPYKCKICNKGFTTKYYLHCHKLFHAGKNPHKCTICDKMFTQKSQLDNHMLRHTGVKNFKCNICNREFLRKSILSTHILTHSSKEFKCNICYMEFTLKSTLDKHMYVHSGNRTYKCSVCYESFCQRFILDEHFRTHLEKNSYACLVCGKRFKQKCLVNLHMVTHSTDRPYQCSKCDKAFSRKFTLERHMMTHNGMRAYKCRHCDRRFRDHYTLKVHMLTHNTDKRQSITC